MFAAMHVAPSNKSELHDSDGMFATLT